MSRIRSRDTNLEKQVRSLLHEAGYRFRLCVNNLPGRPDIVLVKYRTVIFVHGCFWHHHADCFNAATPKTRTAFWKSKFNATIERDQRKADELRSAGWRVIVVWECEVEINPQAVIQRICEELEGEQNAS